MDASFCSDPPSILLRSTFGCILRLRIEENSTSSVTFKKVCFNNFVSRMLKNTSHLTNAENVLQISMINSFLKRFKSSIKFSTKNINLKVNGYFSAAIRTSEFKQFTFL